MTTLTDRTSDSSSLPPWAQTFSHVKLFCPPYGHRFCPLPGVGHHTLWTSRLFEDRSGNSSLTSSSSRTLRCTFCNMRVGSKGYVGGCAYGCNLSLSLSLPLTLSLPSLSLSRARSLSPSLSPSPSLSLSLSLSLSQCARMVRAGGGGGMEAPFRVNLILNLSKKANRKRVDSTKHVEKWNQPT